MTHTPVAPADAPPHEPAPTHAASAATCRNCEAPMHGAFCAQCGQHAVHEDPSFHDLVHDASHEFLHLDGKIVETLRLLFTRPGELTAEHWRGRRVRYVAPIRLYLTLSVLYFLVAALANPIEKAIARRPAVTITEAPASLREAAAVSEDSAARIIEAEARKSGGFFGSFMTHAARVQRDKTGFARRMREALPKIFFAFVPIFAAVVALVYRRRRRYPAHLYFALHYFAFCFAAATMGVGLGLIPGVGAIVGPLVAVAFVGYGLVALRRVYGGTWKGTIGRGALVGLLSAVAFTIAGGLGFAIVFFSF
jgi:hypothetical protein